MQSYNGSLIIESNDYNNQTVTVALQGNGIEPNPDIYTAQDTLDFGEVAEDSTVSLPLVIINIGIEDLEIEEVEFGMGNDSPFSTDFEEATIEAGDSVVVDISFSYTSNRLLIQDILTIYSNDPDEGAFVVFLFAEYTGILEVSYTEGWNIVGLPMLVDNSNYQILFPEAATGSLYSYEGSYNVETDLVPGTGYWLRLITGGIVEFSGSSINDLTLSVNEGWNLISGLSTLVDVAMLYNSGLVVTNGIYGYDGSYINAGMLEPGMGYWVRAISDGEILLTAD